MSWFQLFDFMEKGLGILITVVLLFVNNPASTAQRDSGSGQTELKGFVGRPDISPDGSSIVFIHAQNIDKDAWEIYIADVSGEHVQQLTDFKEARIKKGPVWSPDGRKIAFHADINEGAQIFVIDKNGENLTQLTDLPGYNVEPYWSPDGLEIIFNSIPKDSKAQIFSMNSDGSNISQIHKSTGNDWYPRNTADNRIIFTSDVNHENEYDIFIMNRDGSNLQQLTSEPGINWFPEFSPDGKKILFHSNRDDPELSDSGNYNLYIMDHDGNNIKRMTNLPGQELHAKWYPSGDKLIFESHNEGPLGLHTLDLSTGMISKIILK